MHEKPIFPFLRLCLSFEMNFQTPRRQSDHISRRIRATAGVCRQKQLYLPDRQKQQHNLSCIWNILNVVQRVSKLSFKTLLAERHQCICQQNELEREIMKKTGDAKQKSGEAIVHPGPPLGSPLGRPATNIRCDLGDHRGCQVVNGAGTQWCRSCIVFLNN